MTDRELRIMTGSDGMLVVVDTTTQDWFIVRKANADDLNRYDRSDEDFVLED